MQAKVSDRVGGLKVHYRPNSATLVEPRELNPGYHVVLTGREDQRPKKLWVEISYLFNNKYYTGWVIKEALDLELQHYPPDSIDSNPHIPTLAPSFPWRVVVCVVTGVILAVLAFFVR